MCGKHSCLHLGHVITSQEDFSESCHILGENNLRVGLRDECDVTVRSVVELSVMVHCRPPEYYHIFFSFIACYDDPVEVVGNEKVELLCINSHYSLVFGSLKYKSIQTSNTAGFQLRTGGGKCTQHHSYVAS